MKTMDNIEITKEDIELAQKMWDARQKGLYFNSGLVTQLYNKLYNTNLKATSCGSCIRRRIEQIWSKVEEYKKLTEPPKEEEKKIEENATSKENVNKKRLQHKKDNKSGGESIG